MYHNGAKNMYLLNCVCEKGRLSLQYLIIFEDKVSFIDLCRGIK